MLAMLTITVLALPAFGAILSRDNRPFLRGVDTNGNPSTKNGKHGVGKFYKESTTGYLINVGGALVINQFAGPITYTDQGGALKDPFSGNWYPITEDQQVVYAPTFGLSLSTLLQIHNPVNVP